MGRGSIPLFGANEEKGRHGFCGLVRIREWVKSESLRHDMTVVLICIESGGGRRGGEGSLNLHRACTGNAERRGRDFRGRTGKHHHRGQEGAQKQFVEESKSPLLANPARSGAPGKFGFSGITRAERAEGSDDNRCEDENFFRSRAMKTDPV